jgi:hypothetical protein
MSAPAQAMSAVIAMRVDTWRPRVARASIIGRADAGHRAPVPESIVQVDAGGNRFRCFSGTGMGLDQRSDPPASAIHEKDYRPCGSDRYRPTADRNADRVIESL